LAKIETRARERAIWKNSETNFNDIMNLKVVEDFIRRDLQSQFGSDNSKSNENFKIFYKFFIGTRLYRKYEGTHSHLHWIPEEVFSQIMP
jgi:hypothetical protein